MGDEAYPTKAGDAAFIVQACNSFAALLAALREASDAIGQVGNIVEATGNADWYDLAKRIDAAVARAEKGEA